MVTGCAESSPSFFSQPPKVLLLRPLTPPFDARLLYDSDENMLNAMLFTSLSNEFGGQTSLEGTSDSAWFNGTTMGRAWALSRSDPGKTKMLISTLTCEKLQFLPFSPDSLSVLLRWRCRQRKGDADGLGCWFYENCDMKKINHGFFFWLTWI